MRTMTATRAVGLREAIHRTGYYPEVVADGVSGAVAGEDVVSCYVHHEPTFDRDEIRRHPDRRRADAHEADRRPHRRARGRRDDHRALHLDVDKAIALVTVRSVDADGHGPDVWHRAGRGSV